MHSEWNYTDFIEHVCPNGGHARESLDIVITLLKNKAEFDNKDPLSIENGPWLAGGCFRRLVENGNYDTDFDLFFKNSQQFERFSAWLAEAEKMGFRHSAELRREYRFVHVFENEHITNYRLEVLADDLHEALDIKIQLIHGEFYRENANALLDSFDFTICQLLSDGQKVLAGNSTLYDISKKKLVVNTITFPVASMKRIVKYGRRGYDICNGEATKFLQTVVDSPNILETRFEYID